MITFEEAYRRVMLYSKDFGTETVSLMQSSNRILAESVYADRDFPPFNRSTKDGIAIQYDSFEKGIPFFKIEGVISAGMPQQKLYDSDGCLEIMTGAVLPIQTDTIIMYEDIQIKDGYATIKSTPNKGQNIHKKGEDKKKGDILIEKGIRISPAEIGILASVGKAEILVKKVPKVCVISTGNELVHVSETPLPHQIRTSNVLSLQAALQSENIIATHLHLSDDKKTIKEKLAIAVQENDVLLLSGGVSKGKFDFIPEVMEELGVDKIFHKVLQRPGKPLWFGRNEKLRTVIFSFPGNPVSTFANYHIYFLPWLHNSLGVENESEFVILDDDITNLTTLTLFIHVKIRWYNGTLFANIIANNGSGDLTSLTNSDGFICLPPQEIPYYKGLLVPFIRSK
tara:strand:+ start:101379 stop:102569 length:1191 start_codon:yes stop_codon:yes gene_type:complete